MVRLHFRAWMLFSVFVTGGSFALAGDILREHVADGLVTPAIDATMPSGQPGSRHREDGQKEQRVEPFAINHALSGAWSNPEAAGQGFLIDVPEAQGVVAGAWFTHLDIAAGGRPEHRWLTFVGPFDGAVAEAKLFLTRGGGFTTLGVPTDAEVGSVEFSFTDCTHAEAIYDVSASAISGEGNPTAGPRRTGSIPLVRVTSADACEAIDARRLAHAELTQRLDAILADSVAQNAIIGTQAAVRIPGFPAWQGVQGRNGATDPMRPEYMIGTGSITKLLAVLSALRLVDRGVIALDDPLGKWFAGRPNVNPAVTVKQAMQMVSGIADHLANPALSQAIFADLQRVWTADELIAFIGPQRFAPGTSWEASNANALLLGRIVELETGMSLAEFERLELFQERTSMWLAGFGTPPAPLATQWATATDGSLINMNEQLFGPSLFTSRREVHASASDLAAFIDDLFLGDVLSAALRQAMFEIVPDDGRIAGQVGGGLGIRVYNFLGRTLYGHSGGTQNSSALVLFDPATGITVAVSVNQGGGSHGQSHFDTAPALLQAAIEMVAGLDNAVVHRRAIAKAR